MLYFATLYCCTIVRKFVGGWRRVARSGGGVWRAVAAVACGALWRRRKSATRWCIINDKSFDERRLGGGRISCTRGQRILSRRRALAIGRIHSGRSLDVASLMRDFPGLRCLARRISESKSPATSGWDCSCGFELRAWSRGGSNSLSRYCSCTSCALRLQVALLLLPHFAAATRSLVIALSLSPRAQ